MRTIIARGAEGGVVMAVAVEMEFSGATLAQYDQAVEGMGFQPKGTHRRGCLFHWAAGTDNGFRVVDVWETREQFERFRDEEIGPWADRAGVTEPPTMTFTEVYNYLTAG
jgi:hypothetical protein